LEYLKQSTANVNAATSKKNGHAGKKGREFAERKSKGLKKVVE